MKYEMASLRQAVSKDRVSAESLGMGDGQDGGWLRAHVEVPMCEMFACLWEKPSCASSTLSHLTRLRKLPSGGTTCLTLLV